MVQVSITLPDAQVDERDTMFSRAELKAGTPAYTAYYANQAALQETDDVLRGLPPLLSPGTAYYQPGVMAEAGAHFEAINALEVDATGVREHLAVLAS